MLKAASKLTDLGHRSKKRLPNHQNSKAAEELPVRTLGPKKLTTLKIKFDMFMT